MITKNILKQKIIESFGISDFPINAPLLYREDSSFEECNYIRNVFGKRNWQIVANSNTSLQSGILSFFSAEAFLYYLPCFMFLIIDNYEEMDTMRDAVIRELNPKFESDNLYKFIENGKKFIDIVSITPSQKKTITLFLEFIFFTYNDEDAKTRE